MNSWSRTDYTRNPHYINTHCSQKNIQAKAILPTSKFRFLQKEISSSYKKQVSYQKYSVKSSGMGKRYFPQCPLIASGLNSCSLTWTPHFLWMQIWPTYFIAFLQTPFLRCEDIFSNSKLYLLAVLQLTLAVLPSLTISATGCPTSFFTSQSSSGKRVLRLSLLLSI